MIPRTLGPRLLDLAHQFRLVFLTGPRQSGKTTLARATFPGFHYVSLEDLDARDEAHADPRGFLRRFAGAEGVILDEVQRAPDLFSYLQRIVDEARGGPWILTGSQQFLLSQTGSQSLAGRGAILELLPLSVAEWMRRPARVPETSLGGPSEPLSPPDRGLDEMLFAGLFPRVHAEGLDPVVWLDGYIRTYVERDVRTISGVGDLDAFTRFVGLCAGRAGSLLNTSALGADAGISHVTAKKWLSILRAGYILELLRPHHRNFAKRMVKSPKIYFLDTGLLCRLLGVRRAEDLHVHPLRGQIFENFVFAELWKTFVHHGERPPLFFWRDLRGQEVDFIVDLGSRRIPIEVKAGETVAGDFFAGLDRYVQMSGDSGGVLVYGGAESYGRGRHQVRSWWSLT